MSVKIPAYFNSISGLRTNGLDHCGVDHGLHSSSSLLGAFDVHIPDYSAALCGSSGLLAAHSKKIRSNETKRIAKPMTQEMWTFP